MSIRLTILLSTLTISMLCWSQQKGKKSSRAKLNQSVKTVNKGPVTSPITVLFATNEDCDFYINGETKGSLLKSNFSYLKLLPGKYQYKAVSKAAGVATTDSISIVEGKENEFFIDMLYYADLNKNEFKTPVPNPVTAPNGQVLITYDMIQIVSQVETGRLIPKEAELNKINTLLANMVLIKGGSFVMGNNKSPEKDEVEHNVTVTSFLASKYEVTQQQFETILGYNPSLNRECPTCPVDNVSWEEATRFIKKLNLLSGKKFRLPTEAEWEYLAKMGGKKEVEMLGGQEEYIKKTAWNFTNADKTTHPVGTKEPNAAGLYDLTGNVSEWCADWYGNNFYKDEFSQLNPEGPPVGKEKVIRGGNYKDYVGDRFRPSFRGKRIPTERGSEVGIRLVMDVNN